MPRPSPEEFSTTLPAGPLLVILSGPSGVGKDTVLSRMKASSLPLNFVVTLTTRRRRPSEKENVHYRFVCAEEFETLRANDRLLESANVYGNWYGVPRDDVERSLQAGTDTVVKVDIQGARSLKRVLPQAVSIFLAPSTTDDLRARLAKRRTETAEDLEVRIRAAVNEMEAMPFFDYVVINEWDRVDRAVSDILWIVSMEKCRVASSAQG